MRRSADVGWRCKDLEFSRNFWVGQKGICGIRVVPGGRWLLAADWDGVVTTYDLDSPTLMRRELIMPNGQNATQAVRAVQSTSNPNLPILHLPWFCRQLRIPTPCGFWTFRSGELF
ncbi:hypothetical protein M413DRAFT_115796 [Hebeloma cylindrosporum]|uniref:Uncharacterized protein n=1 Tax=Hebeloma cylindrosporum TaxID=76867 RepID=A0A0C3D018_HEBCY|nr:hypothetical protein M413DRAFT_115796 [Hebeloma cylindrosporum h7]